MLRIRLMMACVIALAAHDALADTAEPLTAIARAKGLKLHAKEAPAPMRMGPPKFIPLTPRNFRSGPPPTSIPIRVQQEEPLPAIPLHRSTATVLSDEQAQQILSLFGTAD